MPSNLQVSFTKKPEIMVTETPVFNHQTTGQERHRPDNVANSETVHYQLKMMFETCRRQNDQVESNYYRLEPGLSSADSGMDNVHPDNLEALHQAGLQFVSANEKELNRIAERLTE